MYRTITCLDRNMSKLEFNSIWAMSKQIITKETENAINYFRLKYVEMLEFIGRYSNHRFNGSCFEFYTLTRKIEMTLNELLKIYPEI